MELSSELSINNAKGDIEPYLFKLKGCYDSALRKYALVIASYNDLWYGRPKASVFHNIINNEVKSTFIGAEGVSIIEKYESILLIIKNYVSARFKKLNKNGQPSNHRSKRNDAIEGQQLQLGYADYPPVAWIDVAYSLDISGQEYKELKVLCRKNGEIFWELKFADINKQTVKTSKVDLNVLKPEESTSRVIVKKIGENRKAK